MTALIALAALWGASAETSPLQVARWTPVDSACGTQERAAPKAVFLSEPDAGWISAQLFVPLEGLSQEDRRALRCLAEVVAEGSRTISRPELLYLTSSGERPRATLEPDHLRLRLGVGKGELRTALRLMRELMTEARLEEASLLHAIEAAPPSREVWNEALQGSLAVSPDLTPRYLRALYPRAFDPAKAVLAVGGPFDAAEAQAIWRQEWSHWSPPRLPRLDRLKPVPAPGLEVGLVDLKGPEKRLTEVDLGRTLTLVTALGVGKGSAMHRALREARGWSYRQEALLTPSERGMRVRLLVATGRSSEEVRSALREAVAAWEEADLARAKGFARAGLSGVVPWGGLRFGGGALSSLEGRTFWAGYWPLKTGREWAPERVREGIDSVTLEALRAEAATLLDELESAPASRENSNPSS